MNNDAARPKTQLPRIDDPQATLRAERGDRMTFLTAECSQAGASTATCYFNPKAITRAAA
ncbi:MAG: hypothetical protein V4773_06140 [Verrucomicrobiota bacterium]